MPATTRTPREPQRLSQNLSAVLRLRELIIDGELRGGERLAEIPLARRLDVSRTPLRLALGQLAVEGLVEPITNGGFVVRRFSRDQVVDAIEMRGLLEGAAARLAAERGPDPSSLEAMLGCAAQIDHLVSPQALTLEDFERYVALNERFHDLLLELSGSAALQEAYRRALALPFASPSAFVMVQSELPRTQWTLYLAQIQHHRILDAVQQRQGSRAEALGREHANLARESLDAAIDRDRAFERVPGFSLIDRTRDPARPGAGTARGG